MPTIRLIAAALSLGMVGPLAVAQDAEPAGDDEVPSVTIGEQGSVQDPLAGRDRGLVEEPQRDPAVHQVEGILGVPALKVKIDPRTLGVGPGEPLPALRREGETLRKRDGRLLPTGDRGYAVFILEPDPEAGDTQPLAMVVAPCMNLESMERLLEDRGEDLRFTLTGEVHTYRGVNYLLPTSQPKPWLIDRQPQAQPDSDAMPDSPVQNDPADAGPNDTDATDPSDTPRDADGDGIDDATPSADEVLERLLRERRDLPDAPRPGRKPIDDATLPDTAPRVLSDPSLVGLGADQPQAELKQEGEFIIARAGRLVRSSDGAQALFVLEADSADSPEPPLIMQACKLLETMEKTVREQGDEVPFVVTGQVFVYRGANYLLPTVVKRQFDRGNLE